MIYHSKMELVTYYLKVKLPLYSVVVSIMFKSMCPSWRYITLECIQLCTNCCGQGRIASGGRGRKINSGKPFFTNFDLTYRNIYSFSIIIFVNLQPLLFNKLCKSFSCITFFSRRACPFISTAKCVVCSSDGNRYHFSDKILVLILQS